MSSSDGPHDRKRLDRPGDKSSLGVDSLERLEGLLGELEDRTKAIRENWQSGEEARLSLLAGRLKALAPGCGDALIGRSVADLEALLLAEEAEASAICDKLEALILQCRNAGRSPA